MKQRFLLAICILIMIAPATILAKEPQTDKEKLSYTFGYRAGEDIKKSGLQIDIDSFAQAIKDVLSDSSLKLSVDQMQGIWNNYVNGLKQERLAAADKNLKAGQQFMAANKTRSGIKETKSGLQYKVLRKGTGAQPKPNGSVTVHYRGTLIDGKEFDSSYRRGEPISFPLSGVIKGWQEALGMMHEGGKWEIYVPPQLAYGTQGAGAIIGPNETLIFDIELLKVK